MGRPDVGIMIGMGAGFLLMGFLPSKKEEKVIETEKSRHRIIGSLVMAVIGTGFILGGLHMLGVLQIPEWLGEYIGALVLILIGLFFLLKAFKII